MVPKFVAVVSYPFTAHYGGVENGCPLAWRVHLIRHQLAQFPGVAMFRLAPERGEMGYSRGLGHGPPFYFSGLVLARAAASKSFPAILAASAPS